ncbi:uncharacterized protein PHACADRAFT_197399 [Phanerochaete carnosa HHB-10118-sp]|uniref:Uncharacterized protein n=1 Tax=Phanerochaete carnosa (strain HHB-10118-sp) TaxID=650164 RepID=K5VND6_PHACS|nr:uncharacterized protein PHACADRAFT_197399 [Phanerochaete carnosa HHB-10118-sp]EKM52968.1 hypothetical protein PHACADRAFT_197399 [Phanerochaete carnosa HHB-10118-sp]
MPVVMTEADNPSGSIDFRDLRTITFLASKYDTPHILEEAHRRLRICFPSSLKDWDSRYCTSSSSLDFPFDTIALKPIDTIAVINLARRCSFNDLLPAAIYTCSQLPLLDLAADVHYGTGDVERLSQGDLTQCLHFIDTFSRDVASLIEDIRDGVALTAEGEAYECYCDGCTMVRDSYMEDTHHIHMPRDFLLHVKKLLDCLSQDYSTCSRYQGIVLKIRPETRDVLWAELRSLAGLTNDAP